MIRLPRKNHQRGINRLPMALVLGGLTSVALYFQNCADVTLQRPAQDDGPGFSSYSSEFRGIFCHLQDQDPVVPRYELGDLYVVNLNVRPINGELVNDSSANGIPDTVDNFDNPRVPTVRISALDSDGDGLPDFLEVLKGLNPNLADAYQDGIDSDGIVNSREIQLGTDPHRKDTQIYTDVVVGREESHPDCGNGQLAYGFSVNKISLKRGRAFIDTTNEDLFNLSHEADENVIMILARMHPLDVTREIIFLAHFFRANINTPIEVNLGPNNFHVLP